MDLSFVFARGWWLGVAALGADVNSLVLVALLVEVGMVLGVLLVMAGVSSPPSQVQQPPAPRHWSSLGFLPTRNVCGADVDQCPPCCVDEDAILGVPSHTHLFEGGSSSLARLAGVVVTINGAHLPLAFRRYLGPLHVARLFVGLFIAQLRALPFLAVTAHGAVTFRQSNCVVCPNCCICFYLPRPKLSF
jgi:hypothetical protein